MHHNCPPELVMLYTKVVICQAFPAYKLSELDGEPAGELLQALRLLDLARQVHQ